MTAACSMTSRARQGRERRLDDLRRRSRPGGRPASRTRTAGDSARTRRWRDPRRAAGRPRVHVAQSASVTSPDTLQATCRARRTGRSAPSTARASPVAIGGLARWSMTNRTVGQAAGQLEGRRQLARLGAGGRRRARPPRRRAMPRTTSSRRSHVGIGLVVDLVPDADEPVAAGPGPQRRRWPLRRLGPSGRPSRRRRG